MADSNIAKKNILRDKMIFNVPCDNCGTIGHDYKHCIEPITSWGIILVKLLDTNNGKNNTAVDIKQFDGSDGIAINSLGDLDTASKCMSSLRFLLVRRKHSLGFTEFVRGNYKKDNITGIIYLFQQMTPSEIKDISELEFDMLWDNFWSGDAKKKKYNIKQYTESKYNFDCLKKQIMVELPLDFYVKNVKPLYTYPEWGFPKGRKTRGEGDIDCAIREFCEETGYNQTDIKIISNVKPIIENIIGTNGKSYRHVYYLAEDISNNVPAIGEKNNNEIGDIGFFSYEETSRIFREYHIEKKNIAKNIFMYYLNDMINKQSASDREPDKDWVIEKDDF